jgi:MFS family permease
MGTTVSLGKFLGTTGIGWISDTKGRIYSFRITGGLLLISAFTLTLAINYYTTLLSLLVIGISAGGDVTNTATILTDMLPLSKRWVLTFTTITWALGSTLLVSFGLVLSFYNLEPMTVFRLVFGFCSVLSVISFILRMVMDETPSFLLATK